MKKQKHKVALTFAIFFGGVHALWAALIMFGVAQAMMDFIFWAHMIHLPFTVGPFDMTAAISLIVVTSAIGYAIGYAGATVWHRVHG